MTVGDLLQWIEDGAYPMDTPLKVWHPDKKLKRVSLDISRVDRSILSSGRVALELVTKGTEE